MKETPIIMSGNHPELILDGLKTMTRRTYGLEEINEHPNLCQFKGITVLGEYAFEMDLQDGTTTMKYAKCPYGQVGDRLWVGETIAEWQGTVEAVKNGDLDEAEALEYIIYKSGAKDWSGILKDKSYGHPWNIRPSIFMPKWASRITLEITEVRAERLQKISREDSLAEGVPWQDYKQDYKWAFAKLWDSLNAKRGYGWDKNKWVWPISFRREG